MDRPFASLLLLAAGRGTRFGGDVPKVWLPLRGRTPVERCVERLARLAPRGEREIVLAVHDDDRARFVEPRRATLFALGVDRIVTGGATRQESMRAALEACSEHATVVAVHDAARPFFPVDAARAALAAAAARGAAILAVPSPDTLKEVDGNVIVTTRPRDRLWAAQTPQCARRDLLAAALARAAADGVAATDEAALLERIGCAVEVVRGSPANLKITSAADWTLAEAIAAREDGDAVQPSRIGLGIDLHRLEPGRRCVLGGVEIDSPVGPVGHSDGDAVLHAITDALLGAAGDADLGTLFSDRDPRNAGRASADFLREARARLAARGLRVASVDVVVEAERPRLAPHRDALRARIAELCAVAVDCVNVKGKSGEGVDAIGRGEALRATAVVLLGPA